MSNILFVCSGNKDRSRTAEDIFSEKFPDHTFDSGGTNHKVCFQLGTTPLSAEQVQWADVIYCMEEKHRQFVKKISEGKQPKTKVLSIPDHYVYNQTELIQLLEDKLLNELSDY